MVTYRRRIVGHGVHDIDNCFALCQAADIGSGKIVAGIKKPGRAIFRLFLLNHRGDIRPAADVPFTVGNPRHFIGFDVGMEIVGVNEGDIFGAGPERQSQQEGGAHCF